MKSLLVIRLGAMGDIIHTLPAVASLRQSFPGVRLTWLVEPRWKPLLEGNPYISELMLLERGSLAGLWRSAKNLWTRRFDLAIDFQGLIKSALAGALGRPERFYGYHRSQAREGAAASFYSHPVKVGATHVVDRHMDLAAAAGATARAFSFPLPQGEPEGSLPEGPFVLASPFAGWGSKQWPIERYMELAKMIRWPLVLNLAQPMQPTAERVHVHVSSLKGLIDATRRAAAVIGVDSGPLHLAAALGRPGVAIFGPTDPARNGPYGTTFTVLREEGATTTYKRGAQSDASMSAITPRVVAEALEARLG